MILPSLVYSKNYLDFKLFFSCFLFLVSFVFLFLLRPVAIKRLIGNSLFSCRFPILYTVQFCFFSVLFANFDSHLLLNYLMLLMMLFLFLLLLLSLACLKFRKKTCMIVKKSKDKPKHLRSLHLRHAAVLL